MKEVLTSIKPEQCELIASGKKSVVVKKTRPKIDVPFKCYIYQSGKNLTKEVHGSDFNKSGYVIGEFVCDKIYDFKMKYLGGFSFDCFSFDEMNNYVGDKIGYGWHISDLKIYDKPKELSEFYKPCSYRGINCLVCAKSGYNDDMRIDCFNYITRPPKSWCYVEELDARNNL